MTEEEEEWRVFEPFGDWYEVSSLGRVRSWRNGRHPGRRHEPKIMATAVNKTNGYQMANLVDLEGGQRCRTVHSLVAEVFIGPRPEGLQVRHLNGIKTDCRAANLTYGTVKENAADKFIHGTQPLGENHHNAKLDRQKVKAIRVLWDSNHFSYKQIAELFNVSIGTVRGALDGRTWSRGKSAA